MSDVPLLSEAKIDFVRTRMSFSLALLSLQDGHRMRRAGWNGAGMWLQLIHPQDYGLSWRERPSDRQIIYKPQPFIMMKTADDGLVPWFPSQTDLLASDWERADYRA